MLLSQEIVVEINKISGGRVFGMRNIDILHTDFYFSRIIVFHPVYVQFRSGCAENSESDLVMGTDPTIISILLCMVGFLSETETFS